jgi:N-acetylglucosamine-6-phosphate deacetylase
MSGRLILYNGNIVSGEEILHNGAVVIRGGEIAEVLPSRGLIRKKGDRVVDCSGAFICPGFIDLHNQGGGGFSVMDGTAESIKGLARVHARHGTTGLLLTPLIETDGFRELLPWLAGLVGQETGGAAILGIHAEGPFINPEKKGAMPPGAIHQPDLAVFEEILSLGDGRIKEMTIAPELPGALDLILRLARQGVIVSLGHSNAGLADVLRAIDCGASHVTHMYNAMSPIHHREPGLAGAALYSSDLTVELIADGFHIHPWILGLTLQNKGPARACLITDASPVMGLADGGYEAMGNRVVLDSGKVTLADNPGTLAGSVLSMDRAVANMINMVGVTVSDAVTMASAAPAAILGIENRKGWIEPGYDADIAILDRTYRTQITVVGGKVVYERKDEI